MLVDRKATDARKFVRSLLAGMENTGVAKDLIAGKLQIYSGGDRKIRGVAKEAVGEVIATERLIFG
jgi:hypothetical protein